MDVHYSINEPLLLNANNLLQASLKKFIMWTLNLLWSFQIEIFKHWSAKAPCITFECMDGWTVF